MANKTLTTKIINRNDVKANWSSVNPVLSIGEIGIEKDTRKFKIGDGISAWNTLEYASAIPAVIKTTNPATSDSSYDVGTTWINNTLNQAYIIYDNTPNNAVWKRIITSEDVSGAGDMLKTTFATIDPVNGYVDKSKTADKLKTAKTINGVPFDGTENITVTDSTKEPTITPDTVSKFWSGTKTWRDLATDVRAIVLTGLSTATNAVITATDSLLVALGKLQKQISDNLATLNSHTSNTSNPHSVTKTQIGLGNVDNTSDATKSVASAAKLTTARTIGITGDVSATGVAFDGTSNISLSTVLANVVTAGTGCKLTVNSKGLVTGIAPLSANDIPVITADKISNLGTAATKNVGTSSGNIVMVNASGKIDDSLLSSLAITDVFEAASQTEMLALADANIGDVCIRSDINKTFILKATPYSSLANWKELKTPTDTVISVNGQTGAISLTTSNISEGTGLYYTEARATANFNSNFAAKASTGLTDGANILRDTDTFILNGGNA